MVRVVTSVLLTIGIVALLGGGVVLGTWLEARSVRRVSLRRAIAARQTTPIAGLREGERAKVRGVVAARAPLVTSPVSGRACVGYRIEIDDASHDPQLSWTPLVSREAWPSFLVKDDTGTVAVDGPSEMLVGASDSGEDLPPGAHALLVEDDVRMKDLWGPRRFHFKETLLEVGDHVIVFGRPSPEIDSAGQPSYREPPQLFVILGSIGEPVVVLNGDEEPNA